MSWFYEHYKGVSAVGVHTEKLLHESSSEFQSIKVFETTGHGRLLTLDDMVMLTELDEFVYHELLSHLALCAHPSPAQVLVVGGGDGGCVREVLKHPSVERVVQCEIDEAVTRVCQEFIPSVAGGLADPRCELVFADAVRYVREHPDTFDVILVDSTEPIGPAKALFGAEFFGDIRGALRPGGIVTAQAESPFYAPDVVRGLFAAVRPLFRHVHPYMGFIPTYPSGAWTFLFASDEASPADIRGEALDALDARYVNAAVATGAFALPAFARDLAGST
jgi:spermidine synthase